MGFADRLGCYTLWYRQFQSVKTANLQSVEKPSRALLAQGVAWAGRAIVNVFQRHCGLVCPSRGV